MGPALQTRDACRRATHAEVRKMIPSACFDTFETAGAPALGTIHRPQIRPTSSPALPKIARRPSASPAALPAESRPTALQQQRLGPYNDHAQRPLYAIATERVQLASYQGGVSNEKPCSPPVAKQSQSDPDAGEAQAVSRAVRTPSNDWPAPMGSKHRHTHTHTHTHTRTHTHTQTKLPHMHKHTHMHMAHEHTHTHTHTRTPTRTNDPLAHSTRHFRPSPDSLFAFTAEAADTGITTRLDATDGPVGFGPSSRGSTHPTHERGRGPPSALGRARVPYSLGT